MIEGSLKFRSEKMKSFEKSKTRLSEDVCLALNFEDPKVYSRL